MPTRLYFKILRILKRNSDVSSFNFLDQESLLDELPSALKNEVLGITRNRILDSFNLFKSKPPQFMLDIIPEFRQISLARDEVIYRKGGFVEDSNYYNYIYSLFSIKWTSWICHRGWIFIQELCKWVLFW